MNTSVLWLLAFVAVASAAPDEMRTHSMELYDPADAVQEFDDAPVTLYDQESDLYEESLMQEEADFKLTKGMAKKMMKSVKKWLSPAAKKFGLVKGVKSLANQKNTFKGLAKKERKEALDAIAFTKKLAYGDGYGLWIGGTSVDQKETAGEMVKNAMYLKAFAAIVSRESDAVTGGAKSRLGALGDLLVEMARKSSKSPVVQYAVIMKRLAKKWDVGLGKYTIHAVAQAMFGSGLVTLGPVPDKVGNYVHIDGTNLGLQHSYPLLGKLSTFVGTFTTEMQKLSKAVTGGYVNFKGAIPRKLTKLDFQRLFRATCYGAGMAFGKCQSRSKGGKANCLALKSASGPPACKWIGSWDGNVAQVVQSEVQA